MINIIKVKVCDKKLSVSGYVPLICGSDKNYLKFGFDETWKKINKKTAVFIVGEDRLYVDFEGDEVRVPVLPNCAEVKFRIVATPLINTEFLTLKAEPGLFARDNDILGKILTELGRTEDGKDESRVN